MLSYIQKASHLKTLKLCLAMVVFAVSLASLLAIKSSSPVEAAACAPTTSYGTDTLSVTAPSTGTYYVWVRMMSPDGVNNQVMMNVGGTCYTMGATMAANTWTWVKTQAGSSTALSIPLTGGTPTTVTLTGNETGVGVDVLLFTQDGTCTPTSTGANCEPVPQVSIPYYLGAGQTNTFTDPSGNVWNADNYFTGGTADSQGAGHTITNANGLSTIFQSERWGTFSYSIPVANGTYDLRLLFAEISPTCTTAGCRVFNVSVQGNSALSNFDIVSQVGQYAADTQDIPVTVSNNTLSISFSTVTNAAKLSGLEILASSPPTVSVSAPTSGSTVNGTVSLGAAASDSVGVKNVQFKVDGTNVGSAITSPPYTTAWNSTTVADGSHTITAVATNDSGVTTTSSTVTVTVANNVCSGSPNAPSNLKDTDTTTPLPSNKVDLSWTAGSAATNCTLAGYNIYRGGTKLNSTPITGTTTYTDSTVSASTTYDYQVTAVQTSGSSPESSKVPASPGLPVTTGSNCASGSGAPTQPLGLKQVTTGTDYTHVAMSWNTSSDTDGCTLSGYHLYRVGTTTPIYTGTAASFTDSGSGLTGGNLASGTTYSYYVAAYDSGGNTSLNSSTVNMVTETDNVAPQAPTGLTATVVSSAAINLSWSESPDLPNPGAVGVGGYYVYRLPGTTPIATINNPAQTTFTDSTVSPSTTYTYDVVEFDKNNNPSSPSTASTPVTTPAAPVTCTGNPSNPTSLAAPTAQITQTSVTLTWQASQPASGCTLEGYEVLLGGNPLPNLAPGSPYTVTGLTPGTYTFSVIAKDTSGHSSVQPTNTVTATIPDTTPPTPPTTFTAIAPTSGTVDLSWHASTDNVGVTSYVITRGTQTFTLAGTATTYVDSTVSPSTSYTYSIVAYDAAGNRSTPPATATIMTPSATCSGQPSQPGTPTYSVLTSTSVSLSWQASQPTTGCSISGYQVWRASGSSSATDLTPNLITSTTYPDTSLSPSTAYTWTIVAIDSSGHGSVSSGGLSLTTLSTYGCTTVYIADVDHNCAVNFADLALFIQDYLTFNGQAVPVGQDGDIGDNGKMDFRDLGLFTYYYPLENGL